jgi:hypothetical protein
MAGPTTPLWDPLSSSSLTHPKQLSCGLRHFPCLAISDLRLKTTWCYFRNRANEEEGRLYRRLAVSRVFMSRGATPIIAIANGRVSIVHVLRIVEGTRRNGCKWTVDKHLGFSNITERGSWFM